MNTETDWRYASQQVLFLKLIDYRFFGFVLLWILWMNKYTAGLMFLAFIVLYVIEVKWKLRINAVFRRIFCKLSGKFKPAVSNRRKMRSDL